MRTYKDTCIQKQKSRTMEPFIPKMSTVLSNIKVARVVNLKLVFMDYFL